MSTKRFPHAAPPRAGGTVSQWLAALDGANPALRAQQLLRLNRIFLECLPAPLARQSGVSNLRDGILIAHALTGPAAHRLRLMAPSVLAALRRRGVEATELQVTAQPRTAEPGKPPKRAVLSVQAVADVDALATSLAPSALRSALEALVRHQRRVRPGG